MTHAPVFDFAAQTSPIFKLALVGIVVGVFAAGVVLFRKLPISTKSFVLVVPVAALIIGVTEYAHTQPAYARVEAGIRAGVQEAQGRFLIRGPGAFSIGEHRFDMRSSHYPALVMEPPLMRQLDGICAKARYTADGDILWLAKSSGSACVDSETGGND